MFQIFRANVSKKTIERWTLWVLAVGILAAVSLNVAKAIVRDYKDLQQEVHRPTRGSFNVVAHPSKASILFAALGQPWMGAAPVYPLAKIGLKTL
jgi:hypothetical protein